MKKLLFVVIFLITAVLQQAVAQERAISGRVTDRASNQGIPGVTVLVKGTTVGASTNSEGNYTLNAPASSNTLTFSSIGYIGTERPINGPTIDVALSADTKQLGEVVVTALGLKANEDQLGTSIAKVQGPALVQSGETSPITALSGKTAGVLITRSTGDPGASANIQIRGASTITGNLQPLIVVDGVPIYNSSVGNDGIISSNGGAGSNQVGGVVQQSRLNDISPDDIASMEVLKGAAAGALWGTRAANGVIVITTKKGKSNNGKVNISYRSSYSIDEINQTPRLQRSYGQGVNGIYDQNNPRSWGDRIDQRAGGADTYVTGPGQYFTKNQDGTFSDLYGGYITFADGSQRYTVAPAGAYLPDQKTRIDGVHGGKNSQDTYNHRNDIFHRGYTWDNNATLSGGDQKGNFYISLGNTHTEGVALNNSDYDRTTFRVNVDRQLSDKFHASVNTSYVHTLSNRIQQGSNTSGIFLGGLRSPADFNNGYYIGTYTDADGNLFPNRQSSYRNKLGANTTANNGTPYSQPGFDNPFWTINNVLNQSRVNRLIGGLELSYDLFKGVSLLNRTGVDTYTDHRYEYLPIGAAAAYTGQLTSEDIQETQVNNDLILRGTKALTSQITGTLLAGFNLNARRSEQVGATASNIVNPFSPPQLGNTLADSRNPYNLLLVQRTAAIYFQSDLALFDQLFLSGTARVEQASTFGPLAKSRFVYPSASLAWQFTKLSALADNNVLSFGKARFAFGIVGVQPQPYQTRTYYANANGSYIADGWGTTLDAANYGGGFVRSSNKGNPLLRPERKREFEAGLDLRFLQNRVGLSGTVYTNRTVDAILSVPVAATTGFTTTSANAATIRNKGIELNLDADIIKTASGFTWNIAPNFSKNRNEVIDLAGAQSISLNGFTGTTSRAVAPDPVTGQKYQLGTLWGSRWERNEQGGYVFDANGFPTLSTTEGVIGDPIPKWRGGLYNTFRYKGLALTVLIDRVDGVDVWNGTRGALDSYGTAAETGVATTVSADQAATLKAFNGKTIAQLYQPNADGTYTFRGSIKDFGAGDVALDEKWFRNGLGNGFNGPAEQFVEHINYTRLREMTLTYSLNQEWFRAKTKLSSVDFSVTGRNLYLWTKYSGVDPETNLTGVSNGRGLDYFNNPSTKSLIFSVRFNY